MEKWFIKSAERDISDLANGIDEKIAYRIFANRGIDTKSKIEEYLHPSLKHMNDPSLLKDIDTAAELVLNAIDSKEKIRVVGDYDVDGVMSSYILVNFIGKNGGVVDYEIPDRVEDGYGINKEIVRRAIADGVRLLITCDNGISAFEAVQFAVDNGVKIIVTDHHDIPFEIVDGEKVYSVPYGDAVINPKQLDDAYPFKELCGAAVAYKLIEYIAGEIGIDDSEVVRDYLEFAAIATVCDVMDLNGENRIIVKYGLELINNTVNIGLKALIEAAQLSDKTIDVYHLGFVIGPSINASGRIASAKAALKLLLSNDLNEAGKLAHELRSLNDERKDMTEEGLKAVLEQVESLNIEESKVLVLYEPTIHESIAGIIAGKVKEKYYRPTIVLTNGKNGVKGSARSIEEYNMHDELMKANYLLKSFGGHKLAAGLSLAEEDIPELRRVLNVEAKLSEDDLTRKIYLDLGLPINYINYELIGLLNRMEPFGKGNPRPVFGAKGVKLNSGKVLGKNRNVLRLDLSQNGDYSQGIYFGDIDLFLENIEKTFGSEVLRDFLGGSTDKIELDIVYSPNINEFNGNTSIQLHISSFRMTN